MHEKSLTNIKATESERNAENGWPNKTKVTQTKAITARKGVVNHLPLFFILNKGLDFITLWLMLLRDSLKRHFPKLVFLLLFLPFAVTAFLFGWLLVTLVPNNM